MKRLQSLLLMLLFYAPTAWADAPLPPVRTAQDQPALVTDGSSTITSIDFVGNREISSHTLLALLSSQVGQPLDPQRVRQDCLRVDLYYEKYLDDASPNSSHVLRAEIKAGRLQFQLHEGLRINRLDLTGLLSLDLVRLQPLLQCRVGRTLRYQELYHDFQLIDANYEASDFQQRDSWQLTADGTLIFKGAIFSIGQILVESDAALSDARRKEILKLCRSAVGAHYHFARATQDCYRLKEVLGYGNVTFDFKTFPNRIEGDLIFTVGPK